MNNTDTLRFILVDDDPRWRERIRKALTDTGKWACLFEAASAHEVLQQLETCRAADVILVDLLLGETSGIDLIAVLRRQLPSNVQLIALTVLADSHTLLEAISKGAIGYLVKNDDIDQLVRLLDALWENGAPLSPEMAQKLIAYFQTKQEMPELPDILSPKEWMILYRLAEGDTYINAAQRLRMSVNTLRYYIKKIYKTINVESKSAAVRWYIEQKRGRSSKNKK